MKIYDINVKINELENNRNIIIINNQRFNCAWYFLKEKDCIQTLFKI